MMSCSVNAGIVARTSVRERLNQTALDSYRYAILESDNYYYFSISPPSIQKKFLGRHIYRYLRPSETFSYIGQQKGQAVEVYKYTPYVTIDNRTLNNLNNNKFYSNIDPDTTFRDQFGILNDQTILKNIFKYKNLYDNQIVFIDVRWLGFEDGRRKSDKTYDGAGNVLFDWWFDDIGGTNMQQEKGNIFRAGTISKESINYINEMIYLDIDYGQQPFNPRKRHRLYI